MSRGLTSHVVKLSVGIFIAGTSLLYAHTQVVHGQAIEWSRQRTGTMAWLHALFFLDSQKGWAAGSKGILLSTTNGGESWSARTLPGSDTVRDIYFADQMTGWLVCERNIYELKGKDDPRAYLLHTTDGGDSWQRVQLSEKDTDLDVRLVRAIFTPDGGALVFGEGGAIFARRDPEIKWVRKQVPTRHLLLGGTFIDQLRGWIVGAGPTILLTNDGGETWELSSLANAKGVRLTAVSFVNSRLGWAVGSDGVVFRTIDGGGTWQPLNSGVTADLNDVKFVSANEGWAAGSQGTIIYTNDGGLHWAVERTGTEHPLERLFFADRSHGWAVGFGGTLLSYGLASTPPLRK